MRVIITGGTGFIGRALAGELLGRGVEVVVPSRSREKVENVFGGRALHASWDGASADGWGHLADGAEAIVNLVGENISRGRWTPEKKRRIFESRVNGGKAVVQAVRAAGNKPRVVVQGSATGYYGPRDHEPIDESAPSGKGFLADVCVAWEASSLPVEEMGVRRVIVRTAPVLGPGGLLRQVVPLFKAFLGGPLGDGGQGFPWIHLEDEVGAIRFLMDNEAAEGPYNLSAPGPVDYRAFAKALGKVLGRPAWLPVPAFALRAAVGEMADEMLLAGQFLRPRRLLEAGFEFKYSELTGALREALQGL